VSRGPIAQRAAFISALIGPLIGALFLFAPIQGGCTTTATSTQPSPGAPAGSLSQPVTLCTNEALWQRQPIFPMPFIAVLVWSVAPVIVYLGIVQRLRGQRASGTAIVVTGLVLEFSVLLSFGAAPFFVPLVLLPLAVTTTFALKRS
jgi:uncharacterized protein YceK